LFADLLRQRLDREQQAEVPELHRRAARWYEQHGHTAEAIDHWLAGGELTQAARLMEENALRTLNRGEMFTVIGWLATVLPELIRSHPWLCIARAWSSLLSGQVEGIETDLLDAAQVVAKSNVEAANQHVLGHVSAIRAYFSLSLTP
jgi:LuxR family maltose regulon positive regulatory protein